MRTGPTHHSMQPTVNLPPQLFPKMRRNHTGKALLETFHHTCKARGVGRGQLYEGPDHQLVTDDGKDTGGRGTGNAGRNADRDSRAVAATYL